MVSFHLRSTTYVCWDTLVVQRERKQNGAVESVLTKYTTEFLHLRERNNIRESKRQRIDPRQYRTSNRITYITKASSMALKAKLMEKYVSTSSSYRSYKENTKTLTLNTNKGKHAPIRMQNPWISNTTNVTNQLISSMNIMKRAGNMKTMMVSSLPKKISNRISTLYSNECYLHLRNMGYARIFSNLIA
ncbi:hypothetical protein OSB04_012561 [Centaurea solstitialis]|uniref:Uncharacterized protein n=1 Tax=Centaurea solstitialis TaxID=347529 RepID=A0AA38WE36_9ASTR|nr:hypothetical protein OSB04_012561 [Centaurea solstitialis]